MVTNRKEYMREYMRAYRARRRAGAPRVNHGACDERIAKLEALIVARNREIGELKNLAAELSDKLMSFSEVNREQLNDMSIMERDISGQQKRIYELEDRLAGAEAELAGYRAVDDLFGK